MLLIKIVLFFNTSLFCLFLFKAYIACHSFVIVLQFVMNFQLMLTECSKSPYHF